MASTPATSASSSSNGSPKNEAANEERSTPTNSNDSIFWNKINTELRQIVSSQDSFSESNRSKLKQLEERIRRRLASSRTQERVRRLSQKTSKAVQRRVRKVVTGSSERRVRDWVQQANVVKNVDKFSFVLGVWTLCGTEYMALTQTASVFGLYYVFLITGMMALRLYLYAKNRYLYFLLDFCYCANAACFISVLVQPQNAQLWRINYAIANGTLLGALLAWRNSLVFHSLDKVTSIAIHLLPALLTFRVRWDADSPMMIHDYSPRLGWKGAFGGPLFFHTAWQLLYIYKTEVLDRERMLADPSIQTSMRWMTRDQKNPMHILAKRICRKLGILQPTEEFAPEATKTKLIFWIGQLLFVLLTLLPVPLLFAHRTLNVAYLLLVLSTAIFNGSNYYFEVFAARYLQQLEAKSSKPPPTEESSDEEGETEETNSNSVKED